MNLSSITILGIRIATSSKKDIFSFILSSKKKLLYIVTPNPEQLVYAQKDKHFAQILNNADVAIPDGIGLVVAMRLFSRLPTTHYPSTSSGSRAEPRDQLPATKRIPGVEFMEDLVAMAAAKGWPVALIGGRGGVAGEALERLKKKYPGLSGWVRELPELSIGDLGDLSNLSNLSNLREKIRKMKTKLVFVGLGAPKQEFLIERLMSYVLHPTSPIVFMSVGGSFDIISGRTLRAPWLVRGMGIEWLWRLVREPWRWRRQVALVKFLWLVFFQ